MIFFFFYIRVYFKKLLKKNWKNHFPKQAKLVLKLVKVKMKSYTQYCEKKWKTGSTRMPIQTEPGIWSPFMDLIQFCRSQVGDCFRGKRKWTANHNLAAAHHRYFLCGSMPYHFFFCGGRGGWGAVKYVPWMRKGWKAASVDDRSPSRFLFPDCHSC